MTDCDTNCHALVTVIGIMKGMPAFNIINKSNYTFIYIFDCKSFSFNNYTDENCLVFALICSEILNGKIAGNHLQ